MEKREKAHKKRGEGRDSSPRTMEAPYSLSSFLTAVAFEIERGKKLKKGKGSIRELLPPTSYRYEEAQGTGKGGKKKAGEEIGESVLSDSMIS